MPQLLPPSQEFVETAATATVGSLLLAYSCFYFWKTDFQYAICTNARAYFITLPP